MSVLPKRVQILKFVAEQGVVSVADVRDYFQDPEYSDSARVIMNQWKLGFSRFRDLRHGIRFIQSQTLLDLLHTYYPDMPHLRIMPIQWHLVEHSLGINRIRVLLEKHSGRHISLWQSENVLRATPFCLRDDIALGRLPDACFYIQKKNGEKQKYFLEYERSLKNKQRYIELFHYYANRADVTSKNVIYICRDQKMVEHLKRIENECVRLGKIDASGKYFQFLNFDDVCQSYSTTTKETKHHEYV